MDSPGVSCCSCPGWSLMRILTGSPSSRTLDAATHCPRWPHVHFSGPDTQSLATVHVPASAFQISVTFNVLDDAATTCLGLENLPVDQAFHQYINVGTPSMTNLACRRAVLLLPREWHTQQLARDFPYGIALRDSTMSFWFPYKLQQGSPKQMR